MSFTLTSGKDFERLDVMAAISSVYALEETFLGFEESAGRPSMTFSFFWTHGSSAIVWPNCLLYPSKVAG